MTATSRCFNRQGIVVGHCWLVSEFFSSQDNAKSAVYKVLVLLTRLDNSYYGLSMHRFDALQKDSTCPGMNFIEISYKSKQTVDRNHHALLIELDKTII